MSTIKTETLSTPSNATVPVDTVVKGTAKAWVNFNGTGTVAIRRAFNVSSITDNGAGLYTISFTTDMPDTNYCLAGAAGSGSTTLANVGQPVGVTPPLVGSVQVNTVFANGSLFDPPTVNVAIFS